jgi:hypothetical protein
VTRWDSVTALIVEDDKLWPRLGWRAGCRMPDAVKISLQI